MGASKFREVEDRQERVKAGWCENRRKAVDLSKELVSIYARSNGGANGLEYTEVIRINWLKEALKDLWHRVRCDEFARSNGIDHVTSPDTNNAARSRRKAQ